MGNPNICGECGGRIDWEGGRHSEKFYFSTYFCSDSCYKIYMDRVREREEAEREERERAEQERQRKLAAEKAKKEAEEKAFIEKASSEIKKIINPIIAEYAASHKKTYNLDAKKGDDDFKTNDKTFGKYLLDLKDDWVNKNYDESKTPEEIDEALAKFIQTRYNNLGEDGKIALTFKDKAESEISIFFGIDVGTGKGIFKFPMDTTVANGSTYTNGAKRYGTEETDKILAYLYKKENDIVKIFKKIDEFLAANDTSGDVCKKILANLPVDFRYLYLIIRTSEAYEYLQNKYKDKPDSAVSKIFAEIKADSQKVKIAKDERIAANEAKRKAEEKAKKLKKFKKAAIKWGSIAAAILACFIGLFVLLAVTEAKPYKDYVGKYEANNQVAVIKGASLKVDGKKESLKNLDIDFGENCFIYSDTVFVKKDSKIDSENHANKIYKNKTAQYAFDETGTVVNETLNYSKYSSYKVALFNNSDNKFVELLKFCGSDLILKESSDKDIPYVIFENKDAFENGSNSLVAGKSFNGKWSNKFTGTITFNNDGTAKIVFNDGEKANGKYRVSSDGKSILYNHRNSGKWYVFTTNNGSSLTYHAGFSSSYKWNEKQ